MKVRILSGNMVGQIVEQVEGEAQNNIACGFVEAVNAEPEPPEEAEPHESEDVPAEVKAPTPPTPAVSPAPKTPVAAAPVKGKHKSKGR